MDMKKRLCIATLIAMISLVVTSCLEPKSTTDHNTSQEQHHNKRSKKSTPKKVEKGCTCQYSKPVTTDNEKISRTFGHILARQLKKTDDFHFDLQQVAIGIHQELSCESAPLTETEYEEKMADLQQVAFDKKSKENLAAAEKFLKENAKQDKIVQLKDNKVQYKIVKEGSGAKLQGTPSALLHYKGSFINGQVFSSSLDNKDPILLPLGQTIPGFALGMQGMREGETRLIYIHPDMAYGTSGQLPPNSLLIFEINLIQTKGEETISANLSSKE